MLPLNTCTFSQMAFWKNYPIDCAPFCGDFSLSHTDRCSVRTSCRTRRTDKVLYGSSILMRGYYPSHRAEDPNVNTVRAKLQTCSIWVRMAAWEGLKGWLVSICLFTPGTLWRELRVKYPKLSEKQVQRPQEKPRGKSILHTIKKGVNVRSLAKMKLNIKSIYVLYIAIM